MADLFQFDKTPGRTAFINGEEYLFFSGYSYLGMQHVPGFITLMKEGIDKYGWLFPSSRISNTRFKIYEECETLLSSLTGAEETVLVSSGFTAGRMAIAKWKDAIINIKPSHPAIEVKYQSHAISSTEKFFAIDSVDPLNAAISNLSFVQNTKELTTVILDDSHGIGLLGPNGEGITSLLPEQKHINYVLTYSLSKAFNIQGGAISCTSSLAKKLRLMPEYTASTASSPALLYAFLHAQELYALQRQKLKDNITYFRSLIDLEKIRSHPLLPVFILPSQIDDRKLAQQKIIISSFAYPDPGGEKIQRIVLSALHTRSDLERLAEMINMAIEE